MIDSQINFLFQVLMACEIELRETVWTNHITFFLTPRLPSLSVILGLYFGIVERCRDEEKRKKEKAKKTKTSIQMKRTKVRIRKNQNKKFHDSHEECTSFLILKTIIQ